MFRNLRWRIAVPYVLLVLVVMAALALYLSNLVHDSYLADLEDQLTGEARLMGDALAPQLVPSGQATDLDALARRWAGLLNARVTLIAADGTVLGESLEDRTQLDNHLQRPEVQQALFSGQGSSIRFSRTAGYDMLYVAIRIKSGDQLVGFARVALSLEQIQAHVTRLRLAVLVATLLGTLLAVVVAILVAERTARPVRQLTEVAGRLAAGDLQARLFPSTRDEVGRLTLTFNDMAGHLQEEMTALDQERSRLGAVLEHMADGALITDGDGGVRLANPAATRLLGIAGDVLGRSFAQVVGHHQLIELWERCRESGEEQVESFELSRQGLFLQVIVTLLPAAEATGYLVILQDLTRVRRLEKVRQDFVSNVSHEIRTPLASLRALVDTLRDGALDDPLAAQRFLDRMEVEVDALTQMAQELLELSRIESGQVPLRLQSVAVSEVVVPPVERLRAQAERAGLTLAVNVPPDLPAVLADTERAQQVVTNLVHNAIKFTPAGGQVTVSTEVAGEEVVIAVRDTGVGISAADLPRIFERFYKADRARSGGGTGLGLAIAKHIVQGHGGRIWAESVEGRGSTFYFSLPAVQQTLTEP
jgi:two-component system phosphate regulon sensor histidine kinase PhoR